MPDGNVLAFPVMAPPRPIPLGDAFALHRSRERVAQLAEEAALDDADTEACFWINGVLDAIEANDVAEAKRCLRFMREGVPL